MPTDFPDAVDTFSNPQPHDNLNSAPVLHDEQHANINDAMVAVQAFLISGAVAAGGVVRLKADAGVLKLYLKDTSGGGTPWHEISLVDIGGGVWGLDINQTGVA